MVVEKIQHEILEAPVIVYNFQVEDYHTYYVANIGVLVHNLYAHQAQLVKTGNHTKIVDIMLQYDKDMDTPWERTKDSLLLEWEKHNDYAIFSTDAQNIDFDNNEENKSRAYFDRKAFRRGFKIIYEKLQKTLHGGG